jgi:hypothetical protein
MTHIQPGRALLQGALMALLLSVIGCSDGNNGGTRAIAEDPEPLLVEPSQVADEFGEPCWFRFNRRVYSSQVLVFAIL